MQVSQSQAIDGTPVDVPVPRKVSFMSQSGEFRAHFVPGTQLGNTVSAKEPLIARSAKLHLFTSFQECLPQRIFSLPEL
jgi:hypothetical protein